VFLRARGPPWGGLRERLNAPVVDESVAVEDHLLHTRLERALGDGGTHRFRGGLVARALERTGQGLLDGAGGRERRAVLVVDDLSVDVLEAAEDRQAGTLGGAERLLADVVLAPRTAHRLLLSLGGHDQPFPPTALPCFRTTTSLS